MFSAARTTAVRSSRTLLSTSTSTTAARALSTSAAAPSALRPLAALSARAWLATSLRNGNVPAPLVRAFSSSLPAKSAAQSDEELISALAAELKFEEEADPSGFEGGPEPEFVTEFKKKGIWKIEESPGVEEVSLVRSYGNETIKLTFAVSDLEHDGAEEVADSAEQEFPDFDEDDAADEGLEEIEEQVNRGASKQGGGAAGKGKLGQRSFSTSAVRPAPKEEAFTDGEEEVTDGEEDQQGELAPIRCAITVTKGDSQGALTIDAVAEDGDWAVESIAFYKEGKLATDMTSEADWTRRGIYSGPQFAHLDINLQQAFGEFLEKRGVDVELAMFVPELAEWKEQKEYSSWLKNVKSWVEA